MAAVFLEFDYGWPGYWIVVEATLQQRARQLVFGALARNAKGAAPVTAINVETMRREFARSVNDKSGYLPLDIWFGFPVPSIYSYVYFMYDILRVLTPTEKVSKFLYVIVLSIFAFVTILGEGIGSQLHLDEPELMSLASRIVNAVTLSISGQEVGY